MQNQENSVAVVLNAPQIKVGITEKNIICADGGYNKLADGTFTLLAIVGDGDSIDKFPAGIKKVICPKEKNYTDGERAVRYAKECGYERVVIYGADGGRSDHVYANLSLLKIARDIGIAAEIKTENGYILYKEKGDTLNLDLGRGDIISVLPFDDAVVVDKSHNLLYPYDKLLLTRSDTRGISNEATGSGVYFEVTEGSALIFITKNSF